MARVVALVHLTEAQEAGPAVTRTLPAATVAELHPHLEAAVARVVATGRTEAHAGADGRSLWIARAAEGR